MSDRWSRLLEVVNSGAFHLDDEALKAARDAVQDHKLYTEAARERARRIRANDAAADREH